MNYTRDEVETLLPTVWDRESVWGIPPKQAPDPDMPKAATNPARSNTLYAALADIKSSWEKAPLTLGERRVLLLRFGLDMKQVDIARTIGSSQPRVSASIYSGVGKATAFLNGEEWKETLDD